MSTVLYIGTVKGRPTSKIYYYEGRGKVPQSIIDDITNLHKGNESITYPTQKPVDLYKRFILASSRKGDVVLDPFCGSGTTIYAAASLDRDFIAIDTNFKAIEITQQRITEANLW